MKSPGSSPRRSPRSLTKAEQIKEAALDRVPCLTPDASPRTSAQQTHEPVLSTPHAHSPMHAASQMGTMASRAGMLAAASSSSQEFVPPARLPMQQLSNQQQQHETFSANDDFEPPVEITPMTVGACSKSSPEKENMIARSHPPSAALVHPPSDAPTSLHTKEYELTRVDTAEFEEWMKGLPNGQKMRVQERLAIRNCIHRAEKAIIALSEGEDQASETWEAASMWQLGHIREDENERYLSVYGYKLADKSHWNGAPCDDGPQIALSVDHHITRVGHTWYMINFKVSGLKDGVDTIEWKAPRRLGQLRLDLHHRVKESLASEIYEENFQHARFAKFGGPRGTTARLNSWLGVLAHIINQGIAPPSVATLVLIFFCAPLPEGFTPPTVDKGFLRTAGNLISQLDNHSHLGGESDAGVSGY